MLPREAVGSSITVFNVAKGSFEDPDTLLAHQCCQGKCCSGVPCSSGLPRETFELLPRTCHGSQETRLC